MNPIIPRLKEEEKNADLLDKMNIRSLSSQIVLPVDPKSRTEGNADVKPQESTERDGDGRQQQAEEELKRNLSDEELQEAMEKLRQLPGVKSNNLRVRLLEEDGIRKIILEDPSGKIVRRMSEAQLWASIQHVDKSTGQLLNKAM